MKRILLLFSVIMLSCIALMAYDVKINGIYYNLDETNKIAEVTYENLRLHFQGKYSGSLTIPSSFTYNSTTYAVTSIGEYAFNYCQSLTSVTIPNSVTSIGKEAFVDCVNLTKVNYLGTVDEWIEIDFEGYHSNPFYYADDLYINGELLTNVIITTADSIMDDAFSGCQSIKSVEIGNSVTSIGSGAFEGCSALKSVTIPNSVTSIGHSAFSYCSGLTSVTIPNSVTSIKQEAFSGCSALTSVAIPNSVTSIGMGAFKGCSGLTSVSIGNSVTYISSDVFYNCSGLTSIVWNAKNYQDFEDERSSPFFEISSQIISFIFGDDVEHIPAYLCYDMNNLKELVIPNDVTSIGNYAFHTAGLYNVESIWDNGVFYVSNYLVRAKKNKMVGTYSIKEGTKVILGDAFDGCELLSSIIIPNSVSSIGSGAFERCIGLTKVNYLGTVDEWAEIDFYYSKSNPTIYAKDLYINNELLTDVKITTADSIKKYAFYNCQSIKSVEIGNSVTSIGGYAFSYCSGLTSVSIGNNVTSIGYDAFYNCSGLTKVNYLGTVDKWVDIDFEYYLYNPTYYAKDLYINNELLTDVKITIADSIKKSAFYNCKSIKSVEIGNSVTSIGACAFYGCSSLTSVVWNARNCANFEDEDSSPFYNEKGSNITSFTIGDDVETIPSYLCNNLVNLKNLIIGRNINSIGNYAFEGCKNLERITIFNEEVPMASNNSFDNYEANLYVLCDAYADYYFDNIFGDFKVQCIEADKIENISKIDVDIDENNNVIISWPSEFGAENYELIISKNIESIKQYNFDSKGQLLSIDSNYRSAQVGYSFTVSGLDSGNKYNYKIIALDKNGNILKEYVGEFALKEIVEIIENLADANISIIDGLITIADTDFSIYNISGQDVTSYNGNLSPGIYIVKNEEIITKVMIR